ncbi:MAG: 4Fe-4S binding protein [Clostridiales bacterium]|jgi:iron only hydrogenase large subunit-like protein|nr:4Fe-4S binding protein [Clostridiales bacterium]
MARIAINTIAANCQDCYRCVRECPVKAIRITGGQAEIEEDLCVECGTCARECPQKAKIIRSDLLEAKEIFASGKTVVASVAPSFAAMYPGPLGRRLPSALRRLGFKLVSETAEGAKYSAVKSFGDNPSGVCTACPAVVNFVEKHRPEFLDSLIPVVSPMIAHGRLLKSIFPGCQVIFIGPCAAKKQEIERPGNAGAIDLALTFQEIDEWLHSEGIYLDDCSESSFDNFFEIGDARLFPLQGGMLKTGNIPNSGTEEDIIHLSGPEDVISVFSGKNDLDGKVIEPLFCKGGCIGGPCFPSNGELVARRRSVIAYAKEAAKPPRLPRVSEINFKASFVSEAKAEEPVSDNQIQKILERTGKVDPIFQLNCGACGYNSCLENAIAVARGMAEPEMCIPYMRRLAQQRSDRIIETTPNGIVILDNSLCMIKMNPAFQKMFMCSTGILGRRVSYLVNAEGFEALQTGSMEKYEAFRSKYSIRYHEILYALREENQYVGIYSDISKIRMDSGQLDVIKSQTLKHAQEFLDHQVRFSQEMAHYLGKSTARSEEIAKRLISLFGSESDGLPK